MPHPIKAISFDFFDTLVYIQHFDSKMAFLHSYKVLNSIIPLDKMDLSYEIFYEEYRAKVKHHLLVRRKFGYDFTNDKLIMQILKSFNLEVSHEDAQRIINAYFESLLPYTVPYPNVKEVIEELAKKYILILVSNHSWPPHGYKVLETIGIGKFFTKIVFSGDIGFAKPHEKMFDKVFRDLNVQKNELFHVGDNPSTDVNGAINYGLYVIWCHTREHLQSTQQLLPQKTSEYYLGEIKEINELPTFLKKKYQNFDTV